MLLYLHGQKKTTFEVVETIHTLFPSSRETRNDNERLTEENEVIAAVLEFIGGSKTGM